MTSAGRRTRGAAMPRTLRVLCALLLALLAPLAGLLPAVAAPLPDAVGLAGIAPAGSAAGGSRPLFAAPPFALDSAAAARGNPYASRELYATVNAALLLDGAADEIVLNLFNDVALVAVRERVELLGDARYTWFGSVRGDPLGSVVLSVENGNVAGSVTANRRQFQVVPLGWAGFHSVAELDTAAFPDEHHVEPPPELLVGQLAEDPAEPPPPSLAARRRRSDGSGGGDDDVTTIDVLILWTPAARDEAGGEDAIRLLAQLAVEQANGAYANSDVALRLRLVHAEAIDYVESSDMSRDLSRLATVNDGFADGVHALRDLHGADVVSMFTTGGQYCGIAYMMRNPSSRFASLAFSVVDFWCATGVMSFAHEVGHNLGGLRTYAHACELAG
ncbi:hypothetical protein DFJ74DRAFT_656007 [Hyaloraphidium curvatum]|nr:hypothetical protein DFJ74DRAFT_656007 [Hyaloraphidium curvatum]